MNSSKATRRASRSAILASFFLFSSYKSLVVIVNIGMTLPVASAYLASAGDINPSSSISSSSPGYGVIDTKESNPNLSTSWAINPKIEKFIDNIYNYDQSINYGNIH